MEIIDISWPISSATTGYKDRKVVEFHERKTFAKDGFRESTITVDSHSGTHIDAPFHFLSDGKTIDQLNLASVVGKAQVIDCMTVSDAITREFLEEQNIQQGDIILLKTINSQKNATDTFSPDFIYLHSSGAQYLAEKKVKAVGIDYLGIERGQPGHPTHLELMKNNIAIIEGLRLNAVSAGSYQFVCLPLYVIGLEAAPARAILITE